MNVAGHDPLIDPHVFDELQANVGADFVVELVDTFAEEGPLLLSQLRQAQAAGDGDRLRRLAHSLKSNSSTFGARHLADQARALELGGLAADTRPLDSLAQAFGTTLEALQQMARR
jgi:HPt (histidine-containing phosphotransfer) domain-containing protein